MRFTRRYILILCAVLLPIAMLLLAGCRSFHLGGSGGQNGGEGGNDVVCPIDGLPTTREAIAHRPVAVMIENSPAARPQSGVSQACVVYEAITEGGITRFLAIFLHNAPEVIGPVRSARPHFINLAQEYNPVYVHCGESYEALQILAYNSPVDDLDQLKFGKPFWRSHQRPAPHNLYTSQKRLMEFIEKHQWDRSISDLPTFSHGGQFTGGTPAQEVTINFNGAVHYRLRFVYDQQAGGYLRYMDGKLHVDKETGKPIVAKNIVIQRVSAVEFPNSEKHTFDVSVIGSGDGYFVSQGKQTPLLWSKYGASSITNYTDADRQPLPFQPGQTWIELVPLNGKVTITAPASPA